MRTGGLKPASAQTIKGDFHSGTLFYRTGRSWRVCDADARWIAGPLRRRDCGGGEGRSKRWHANPDRIGELEVEIATLRGQESDEMRELRAANRNMAEHIQALSLLIREHEQRIAKLQLELSESARVVPLVGLARR